MKRNCRLLASLILVLVLASLTSMQTAMAGDSEDDGAAVDPVKNSDKYSAILYDFNNGLPSAEANDIAQTSEGFIWIGCYAGLIRYDGRTFERLDSTEGVNSISSLHVDKYDRLWIGTNDSGVAVMEKGEFTFWGKKEGLGSNKVCEIEEDEYGNIYVGTTNGITMFTPDLIMQQLDDPKIKNVYIDSMVEGSNGFLYCIANDDDMFIMKKDNLIAYYNSDQLAIDGINCVVPDPKHEGLLYFGTEDSGLYHGRWNDGKDKAEHFSIDPLSSVMELKFIGDQLWVCSRTGIGVLDEDGFHDLTNLPINNSVDHLMMDQEGNLWFTSTRQGVMKLVPNQFTDVFKRYDIPETVVNSTCLSGDDLFVGADTGLIVIGKDGPKESIPLSSAVTASGKAVGETDLISMLNGVRIRSIIKDSKGRLWISTWRNQGLLRYDNGSLLVFGQDDGLLSDHIRAVCERDDGSMLVALTGGINIIEGDKVTKSYGQNEGIVNEETLYVTSAQNGDILVGSNGDGIYIIPADGSEIRSITDEDGLTSGVIMRIKYDPERKVYWLVTGNSVAYMDESYKVTTIKKFPYPDNLDIHWNSKGDMWIVSTDGIYVLPTKQLIKNKKITPIHYGIANGMQSIATGNSYDELTEDGDLYLSSRNGVTKFNIEESLESVDEATQAVPFLDADGKRIYAGDNGFEVPAGTQKLTIYAEVFDYSLTDPQVSYRLRGFDRKDVTVKRSELDPIVYTNLPGGSYVFRMELKDALGRGSNKLEVKISKKKALYERGWIYLILIIVGLAAANVYAGFKMRRKLKDMEEKHRKEAEQERISNELKMASGIQSSVLPHDFPPFPERKEFDIYATMDPAREVGGDFYDFFMIDDDHLALVMADVSGKGIPASLFMMNSKVILKTYAMNNHTPAEILEKTNDEMCSNNLLDMFVTVWLGILEISTGKLVSANAGHEHPAIKLGSGDFELIKKRHGFVIGGMDGVTYKNFETQLEPGDMVFVYTDGVPEATNADNEMFGTDRMMQTLNADKDASTWHVLTNMKAAVHDFVQDAEQFDDLTMLAMKYYGTDEANWEKYSEEIEQAETEGSEE